MVEKGDVFKDQANKYLDEILEKMSEKSLANLITQRGSARLNDAVLLLRSTAEWKDIIEAAITTKKYDTTIVAKLIDKAIPTPQSVKSDPDEGFILEIEHIYLPTISVGQTMNSKESNDSTKIQVSSSSDSGNDSK